MAMPFNDAVVTEAGIRLLNKAQAGGAKIEFTRIAAGNGQYEEAERDAGILRAAAGLKSLKNSYGISSFYIAPENSIKLTALITNYDPVTQEVLVAEDYYINEIGVYAKEKDGADSTEILYSIAVTSGENGDYMPAFNGSNPVEIVQEYYVTVYDSEKISVSIDPGAAALAVDLLAAKLEIEKLQKNKVDKVVGKGLSANDFTDEEKGKVAQIGNASNQANSAYSRANSAYSQANAAYNAANTASTTASSAYTKANSAATTAASAYTQANTAYNRANTAYNQANSAYSRANSAYSQANSAINKVSTLPIAIGDQLNLSGEYSIAIGLLTISRGDYSVAVGSYSKADTEYSTALGPFAKSEGAHSAAVGEGANAIGDRSVAFGYDASASGLNSAAIGANTIAGSMSSALGAYANACGNNTAAVGYGAYAVRDSDTAVGRNASASGGNSTALGCNAYTSTPNSMQLGNASMLSSLSCRVSLTTTSDERDKTDITEIGDGAVEFLKKVKAIRYVLNHRELYIDEENLPEDEKKKKEKYGLCGYDREAHAKGTKKGSRIRVGVSAQETQRALEEVYGSSSYANLINDNLFDVDPDEIPEGVENQLSANYEGFIPFLIKAVQELDARLEEMEGLMKGAVTA